MIYPAAILLNKKTQRFHPILFRESPLPGGTVDALGNIHRYKSLGHHTDGFDTLEQAQDSLKKEPVPSGYRIVDTGIQFDWDGEDVPAMVEFFNAKELENQK